MRYWLEDIPARCVGCKRREARVRLWVDPGPEQPTRLFGMFCKPCGRVELAIQQRAARNIATAPLGE